MMLRPYGRRGSLLTFMGDAAILTTIIFLRKSWAMGELLQRPAVAIGIAEVDEMPPILHIDLADFSASFEQFLANGSRVLNHHLQPFLRSRRHVCNPNPNGDRTGGTLR